MIQEGHAHLRVLWRPSHTQITSTSIKFRIHHRNVRTEERRWKLSVTNLSWGHFFTNTSLKREAGTWWCVYTFMKHHWEHISYCFVFFVSGNLIHVLTLRQPGAVICTHVNHKDCNQSVCAQHSKQSVVFLFCFFLLTEALGLISIQKWLFTMIVSSHYLQHQLRPEMLKRPEWNWSWMKVKFDGNQSESSVVYSSRLISEMQMSIKGDLK